jgi:hypothetical protein
MCARTDRHVEGKVAFRDFANAPKSGLVLTDTDISCIFVLRYAVMEEPVFTLRVGGGDYLDLCLCKNNRRMFPELFRRK